MESFARYYEKGLIILSNAWIRGLCGVAKWVDERIDESFLRWFGHTERMENNSIAKKCM